MRRILVTCTILTLLVPAASAADFYVDPENGKADNDGSKDRPWKSLQKVFDSGLVRSRKWESLPYKKHKRLVARNSNAAVRAGDTIWLMSGYYGDLEIDGYYNTGYITIAAAEGQKPRFRTVLVRSSSHWVLRGLHVSPAFGQGKKPRTMVELASHGWRGPIHHVTLEDCTIRSADDASAWSKNDWNNRSCNGISADGLHMIIRGNHLKNVNFGISVGASHSLVERNVVENFAGDGLRGLGDYTTFQYNVVKNCYDVNKNHDDGFQSWTKGRKGVGTGKVVDIVLRGNTIINYSDPRQQHRGTLQGIGCFDGMFVDWVVENNVVITDHWHGITLLGATGCRIVNNTVMDLNDDRPGPPWIMIGKHKEGAAPKNCVVANNLVTTVKIPSGKDVADVNNMIIKNPRALFVDPAKFDLRLRRGSPAIDAAEPKFAPETDITGADRPQGLAPDVGAYEFKEDK